MTIEEILKDAGITDTDVVSKVSAAMPQSFIPLAEFNKRLGASKAETAEKVKEIDNLQKQIEADKAAAEASKQGEATEADKLRKEIEKLQGDFSQAKEAARAAKARAVIVAKLNEAGANPAAVEILADKLLSGVTYNEADEPMNVDDSVASFKTSNEGLFGTVVSSGAKQASADPGSNSGADPFMDGFGKID